MYNGMMEGEDVITEEEDEGGDTKGRRKGNPFGG